jgi:hypothetical protein
MELTFPVKRHCEVWQTDETLRQNAYLSLLKWKDICIYPTVCRYFILEISEYSITGRSFPERRKQNVIAYAHKQCRVNQRGYSNINSTCPSKTTTTLDELLAK